MLKIMSSRLILLEATRFLLNMGGTTPEYIMQGNAANKVILIRTRTTSVSLDATRECCDSAWL